MKLENCSFSGYKIYPSRGRVFIRGDSKTFRFLSSKTNSLFDQEKNPRKIAWTRIYRKAHRKGLKEETSKKRTRRAVKYNRAVVGVSWEAINARRNEKTDVRAAARAEAAVKAKEKRKKEAAEKKAARANAPAAEKAKFSKQQARGAVSKPKPTSR
ncbi:60S ribosomal protein L24 [Coemansia sp. RSA 1939]|nr:60S ribosomal protein L24 [Coemansia sp. RSA 1939]KAJ2611892.1 60S ribosomal protein L24 [Coemansia sp. RSA 1804]KAJ2691283.1 60S ribosomal protein L24 [Coemansia sp. RSA 1285]